MENKNGGSRWNWLLTDWAVSNCTLINSHDCQDKCNDNESNMQTNHCWRGEEKSTPCKAVVFLVYASLYISKSTQLFRGTAGPDSLSSHYNMCILLICWSCCIGRYASQLTVKYLICQLLHRRSPLQLCNARGGWLDWKSKDLTFSEILRNCLFVPKMTGKCHNLKQGGKKSMNKIMMRIRRILPTFDECRCRSVKGQWGGSCVWCPWRGSRRSCFLWSAPYVACCPLSPSRTHYRLLDALQVP